MRDDLLIRRLGPEDAAKYQAQRLDALLNSPTAFSSSYEAEAMLPLEAVAARLGPESGRVLFGAFAGAELAGSVAFGRETGIKLAHKGFIRAMNVVPAYRRRGIGRRLLEQVFAHARTQPGLRQLTLVVSASNPGALALYESLGFRVYGREPDALLIDGVFHDDLLLMRYLEPAS